MALKRRIAIAFVMAVFTAGMASIGGASIASATSGHCESNFPWASETEMADYQGSHAFDCKRNFVTDPGRGNLLDPNSITGIDGLLTPDRVAFYTDRGFNENFLWYAPRAKTEVGPNDTRNWTACLDGILEGGICNRLKVDTVKRDFDGTFDLSIIGYEHTFIALTCGNYASNDYTNFTPVAPVPDLIPRFDGIKFRDDNRNGVRDSGEQTIEGWQIRVTRISSRVGQGSGQVANLVTDVDGKYRFDLDGHGPGRYTVEEIPQAGWKNYTPISYTIDVDFGIEGRRFTRDFGNTETMVDVAKTSMTVIDPPETFDVNTPTDVTVSVTIENLGPADQVPVRDELTIANLPSDCVVFDPDRSFTALLYRDQPISREFVFTITCTRPSEHFFEFDDHVSITDPVIIDSNEYNNYKSTSFTAAVHAYTDLGIATSLGCIEETDVGQEANCTVDLTVTNDGFGPIDATAVVELALPADCSSDPGMVTLDFDGLVDGATVQMAQSFAVVCTHRSFHEIAVSAAINADDPHVFDTNPANDTAGDGPSIIEVFNDASMAVTDVHLVCNEVLGVSSFTCTTTVEYVKTGPAPFVEVVLWAELDEVDGCTAGPAQRQEVTSVLDGSATHVWVFSWALECSVGDVLHPFWVATDIGPSENEPHAQDDPDPEMDHWVVPYCLPTVNPHGQTEPQAPGSGMNEDGFYIFGTLRSSDGGMVSIRDDASGMVFGPFEDGTRIKWVEANGAEPSITEMGGNSGKGKGQALTVDYQIKAQGDAQSFFVDEKGVEVSVTCLVPPFPK